MIDTTHGQQSPPVLPEPLRPKTFSGFEYRGRTEGGMTRPFRVAGRDGRGRPVSLIVKVRNPDAASGHHAGTSLACEMTFSILGRALGLNVPDYGFVDVTDTFARSVPDSAARQSMLRNVGLNFAVEFLAHRYSWPHRCPRTTGELRQALDDVLSFDAIVFNADRTAGNPNLLWDGRDTVYPIDHSLACPANKWSDDDIAKSPLLPEDRVHKHCGFSYLRNFGASFDNVADRWQTLVSDDFWTALRAVIPPNWYQQEGDVDRIFRFLRERVTRVAEVSRELRRIVR